MSICLARATLLASVIALPALAAPPAYIAVPVPGIAPYGHAVMNRWGQVAGSSATTNGPALWTPKPANGVVGTLTNIVAQPGYPANAVAGSPGSVEAMNDRGQVTGLANVTTGGDANSKVTYVWRQNTLNSLTGALFGAKGTSVALPQVSTVFPLAVYPASINNAGVIAGHGSYYNPVLLTPAVPNGTSFAASFDNAIGTTTFFVNDSGQVAGSAYGGALANPGYDNAFVQAGFPPFSLAGLFTDPSWSATHHTVYALNTLGDTVIRAVPTSVNEVHSYLRRNGTITDIGGGFSAFASAMNDSDMILAARTEGPRSYAVLIVNGVATHLEDVVPATTTAGQAFTFGGFTYPGSINASGQILAIGSDTAGNGTFILTPAANIPGKQPKVASGAPVPAGPGLFKRKVTVTNTTAATLAGPLSVAFDRLPAGVTIPAALGTTRFAGPANDPYVNLPVASLAPAAAASVTVVFAAPAAGAVTYTARLLVGGAPR